MIRRRKVLMWFSRKMEEKLRENDYKGGWDTCTNDFLFAKLNEETDELKRAMFKYLDSYPRVELREDTIKNVVREAADVANIVMMIADNIDEELK